MFMFAGPGASSMPVMSSSFSCSILGFFARNSSSLAVPGAADWFARGKPGCSSTMVCLEGASCLSVLSLVLSLFLSPNVTSWLSEVSVLFGGSFPLSPSSGLPSTGRVRIFSKESTGPLSIPRADVPLHAAAWAASSSASDPVDPVVALLPTLGRALEVPAIPVPPLPPPLGCAPSGLSFFLILSDLPPSPWTGLESMVSSQSTKPLSHLADSLFLFTRSGGGLGGKKRICRKQERKGPQRAARRSALVFPKNSQDERREWRERKDSEGPKMQETLSKRGDNDAAFRVQISSLEPKWEKKHIRQQSQFLNFSNSHYAQRSS